RLVEDDLVHRDGEHHAAALPARLDRAGLVDVREDDAAENGAVRVGVARHHEHPDGGLIPLWRYINQYYSPACCGVDCCLVRLSLMSTLASLRNRCRRVVRRLRASCMRIVSPYDVRSSADFASTFFCSRTWNTTAPSATCTGPFTSPTFAAIAASTRGVVSP